MPLYLVSVKLRRSALTETIREYPDRDLEKIYQKLYYACEKKYGSKLQHFDCVMISKRSKKAIQFKKDQAKKEIDLSELPMNLPVGKIKKSEPTQAWAERINSEGTVKQPGTLK